MSFQCSSAASSMPSRCCATPHSGRDATPSSPSPGKIGFVTARCSPSDAVIAILAAGASSRDLDRCPIRIELHDSLEIAYHRLVPRTTAAAAAVEAGLPRQTSRGRFIQDILILPMFDPGARVSALAVSMYA